MTSPKVTSTPRDHLSEGHQIKIKSINHQAVTQCPERARTKKGKLQRTLLCRGGRGGGGTYVGRVKEAAAETSGKLVPSCDESFQVFLQGKQEEEVAL